MTNILIVESKNDQHFLQYLIKHLNYQIEIDEPICIRDDDYECLNGLNEKRLVQTLKELAASLQKRDIQKIGIIIDQDNDTEHERIDFVNRCLAAVFTMPQNMARTHELIELKTQSNITFQLGCYFTQVDHQGELETVLKTIKSQPSPYADCLKQWRECLDQENKITDKEFDKFWWSIYLRYDTCTPKDKKQAEKNCSMKNFDIVLNKKGAKILDLEHPILNDLKAFLKLFDA